MAVLEVVRPERPSPAAGIEARAADALLRCIARYGLTKTTLDDVAREAGCSRATLYRYFADKQDLVRRTAAREIGNLTTATVSAARAESTFADAVVAAAITAARELKAHGALQFLLDHEPGTILPHLTFAQGDRVLTEIADAVAHAFRPWCSDHDATQVADWLTRLLRSYVLMPEPTIDFTDAAAATHFLDEYVIPGLLLNLAESR